MTPLRRAAAALACAAAALLAACAGRPVPDWQLNSKAAIDRSVTAYLSGDSLLARKQFELGRGEVARTGRPDLLARVELIRCAARVASLQFETCDGFESLRPLAGAAEGAYADFLAGRLRAQDAGLLPPAQRIAAAAGTGSDSAAGALRGIEDPFSRLVAAAVLFQMGRADPATIELAVETASSQGWRRPLLAWLNVQASRAEKAGAADDAARLRRRIELIQQPD